MPDAGCGIAAASWPDLAALKSLRLVEPGNNGYTKAEQQAIRLKLPAATRVDFTNIWDEGGNEE